MHSLGVFSDIQTHLRLRSTSKWKQEKSPQHSPSIFFKRNLVILGLRLYSISIHALLVAGVSSPEVNQLKCTFQNNRINNILKNNWLPTKKLQFSIYGLFLTIHIILEIGIPLGKLAVLGHPRPFQNTLFIVVEKGRDHIFGECLPESNTGIPRQFAR